MKITAFFLAVTAALLVTTHSLAQPTGPRQSPAEVMANARNSSVEFQQLLDSLSGPNPAVRMATFMAMIDSNNPALISAAIATGATSSDPAIRNVAIRAAFRELKVISIKIEDSLTEELSKEYLRFNNPGNMVLTVESFDFNSGSLKIWNGRGQVSGGTFTFASHNCQGSLSMREGSWKLEGYATCHTLPRVRVSTTIR